MWNSVHFRFRIPVQKQAEHGTERKSPKWPKTGIRNTQTEIPHIPADDVMLAIENRAVWTHQTPGQTEPKKTEYLVTDVTEPGSIKVNGIELPRAAVFNFATVMKQSSGLPPHQDRPEMPVL
ncbi:unnamed protein product [Heligmosomoides polygyrus]|uniref:Uncharacterized protein n=1 Tax=Heligmosomoides polygyrus TaxID=6339 RepID=A0A183GI48_HELPZ|nr:unnamed protein product [Heligmosomoides polygyrus]